MKANSQHGRTIRRLTLALAISFGVFRGSVYVATKLSPLNERDKSQKHVAVATQISDEVERRPVTSLVWNLVETGEQLFPGEAIKTSDKGEVRIQFADSARFIDLEPDSLIVISQGGNNEISLDLQGGSLFVSQGDKTKASGSSEPSLMLNSGNGKVDLSNATAQLSKSSGKDVDVQVLKGKAKIEFNGQSKEIDAGKNLSSLEILLPSLDKPFFINPENPQPVQFKWKGFPANATVALLSGKSRKTLKATSPIVDLTGTTLTAKFPVGKYFWKLIARDKNSQQVVQESAVYRLEVSSLYAPSQLSPAPDAQILKIKPEMTVEFKWSKPESVQSVYLEVGKDLLLKDKVFTQNVLDQESARKSLPEGTYYWRLSGSYEGIEKPIVSKITKFIITPQIIPKEPPKPPVSISWINPLETAPQYFVGTPLASLAWTSEQKNQVKFWRLKLAPSEQDLNKSVSPDLISQDTKDLSMKAVVKKPGRYIAMIEALDEKQQILAKSNFKSIEISPLPLLASPEFIPASGDLKANNQGKLSLQWDPIEGAKEYWLTLFDANGKEIRKAKFQKSSTSLINLLPGQYKVAVVAIDQHGRETIKNEPRNVLVPDTSGLLAPKLKKIKVH